MTTKQEMNRVKRKVKRGWRWADNNALSVALAENLALVFGLRPEAVWEWARTYHINIVESYHTLRDPRNDLFSCVCSFQPMNQSKGKK